MPKRKSPTLATLAAARAVKPKQADVFWDSSGYQFVDSETLTDVSPRYDTLHQAIVAAIGEGYEIRQFRSTRGGVKVTGPMP
jgi:hypothetical protein